MFKEIIYPKDEYYTIHIPKEYINRKVEVIIKPIKRLKAVKLNTKNFEFNREEANAR